MASPLLPEIVFDERLPQLCDLLDRQRMRDLFERKLTANGYHIEDCHVVRAKLRPGRNCLVSYRLTLLESKFGEQRDQFLSLIAFGKGESLGRFAAAQRQPIISTAIGNGLFHLPELEGIVWAFPNDRKLSGLPAISDSKRLKSLLPEVVTKSFGGEWKITGLKSEVVNYAAERACTVRAELELLNLQTGEIKTHVLFGKTYCPEDGDAAWRTMQLLWQSEACRQGGMLMPQPLAWQPEINTLWQQGLMGRELDAYEFGSEEMHRLLEKAGAAVAALHSIVLSELPQCDAANPLSKLKAAEKVLACAFPSCQQKLDSLVNCLTAKAGMIGQRPSVTLHGDLHLKNFFVAGGQVALLDWDSICQGDPLQDIGSFIASLHYRGLLEDASIHSPERFIRPFVDGYRAAADGEFSAAALDWHTAAALVYERAYRHFTRLKAEPPHLVEDLIELASQFSEKL